MPKQVRALNLILEEESLAARLEVNRGHSSMNQLEKVYMVTPNALDLNNHKRLHYHGTNRGNAVGPIAVPAWSSDTVWQEQVKAKREIFQEASPYPTMTPASLYYILR